MPDTVKVVKVKAHLSFDDVLNGRISLPDWVGNSLADKFAKAGCEVATAMSPTNVIASQWKRAREWYKWVVAFTANWPSDIALAGPITPPRHHWASQ